MLLLALVPRNHDMHHPIIDESRDRLHRAGWSIGDYGTANRFLVCGSNGENQVQAGAASRAEAYWGACVQARALGMLAPLKDAAQRHQREGEAGPCR
jgi:hypothetical protein